jgi:hypothetical protein
VLLKMLAQLSLSPYVLTHANPLCDDQINPLE